MIEADLGLIIRSIISQFKSSLSNKNIKKIDIFIEIRLQIVIVGRTLKKIWSTKSSLLKTGPVLVKHSIRGKIRLK